MTRESTTQAIHWTVESLTSCSVSICHRHRPRQRGKIGDIVMMSILVLTFLFLSWIINHPVIGWSWLKKLTHCVYPFNIAWCIVEINIYTESESRGFYCGCLSVTCHILRTSAGFMKINNRKESVQKRGNCPIFPAFTLSLYCGGDIRGGHQLPPHWWPCWVGDISHWMITEGGTKKTAVEIRVTNWKNLEIPPKKSKLWMVIYWKFTLQQLLMLPKLVCPTIEDYLIRIYTCLLSLATPVWDLFVVGSLWRQCLNLYKLWENPSGFSDPTPV